MLAGMVCSAGSLAKVQTCLGEDECPNLDGTWKKDGMMIKAEIGTLAIQSK